MVTKANVTSRVTHTEAFSKTPPKRVTLVERVPQANAKRVTPTLSLHYYTYELSMSLTSASRTHLM